MTKRAAAVQEKGARTLAESSHRRLGAYYTPEVAARFMAGWAIRSGSDRVLEPAMGEGEFLRAVDWIAARNGEARVETWGVEIARDTYAATVAGGLVHREHALLGDFLAVKPFPVDVVIGNPPYVRLRHAPRVEANRARRVAERVLGAPMEADGSLWMPFVLHGTQFLALGGRLAFVLPYDSTYVRYARPMWRFLANRFRSLRVVRVHERVFPDILQEVVLLLADGWGGSTDEVIFQAFETRADLSAQSPRVATSIKIEDAVSGSRPFVEALLPAELRTLLSERVYSMTAPLRESVTFNIGYVSGDKRFFHPTETNIARYQISPDSLVPAIASGRAIRSAGIYTSHFSAGISTSLFLPSGDEDRQTHGDRAYIRHGKRSGVSKRYKCRVREPWYVTPDVRTPDLLLPVFADNPVLLVNDGRYTASNSLLVGQVHERTPEIIAAAWYTSLTLLDVELNVHSLGGGVMVFVPREAGSIRLPVGELSTDHLENVQRLIRSGDINRAYASGDDAVLMSHVGLDRDAIELIKAGTEILRHWRKGRA